ncbi:hypothetical protein [Microbulbifer sp. ZKSA002]|uniref:hypothetical protein n=1 Tax=Microbulbifer sp. ZKSA002 TaxID=3243388 RepID=UPI00403A0A4B
MQWYSLGWGITDLMFNEREDRLLISVTATLLDERAGSPFYECEKVVKGQKSYLNRFTFTHLHFDYE